MRGSSEEPEPDSVKPDSVNEEGGKKKGQDALTAYCVNLNEKAKTGRIDPLIGRMEEVNRTIQILCRRSKNNPSLCRRSRRRQDRNRRGPGQAHRRG